MTDKELEALYGTEGAKIAIDVLKRLWRGIPFSERIPGTNEPILVYFPEDKTWYIAQHDPEEWAWLRATQRLHATHWLPQPPAPEPQP